MNLEKRKSHWGHFQATNIAHPMRAGMGGKSPRFVTVVMSDSPRRDCGLRSGAGQAPGSFSANLHKHFQKLPKISFKGGGVNGFIFSPRKEQSAGGEV